MVYNQSFIFSFSQSINSFINTTPLSPAILLVNFCSFRHSSHRYDCRHQHAYRTQPPKSVLPEFPFFSPTSSFRLGTELDFVSLLQQKQLISTTNVTCWICLVIKTASSTSNVPRRQQFPSIMLYAVFHPLWNACTSSNRQCNEYCRRWQLFTSQLQEFTTSGRPQKSKSIRNLCTSHAHYFDGIRNA